MDALLSDPHFIAYCWLVLAGGMMLTVVIIRKPWEPSLAIAFYLAIPFVVIGMMLSIPFALYAAISGLWHEEIKKRTRLQVKRR